MDGLLVAVVVTALVFDFTNGFHDAANAVATSISTRALPPNVALFGAAVLNVVGALVSTHVAATLAKGIVEPGAVTPPVMLGGLVGAIVVEPAHLVVGAALELVPLPDRRHRRRGARRAPAPTPVQWSGIVAEGADPDGRRAARRLQRRHRC